MHISLDIHAGEMARWRGRGGYPIYMHISNLNHNTTKTVASKKKEENKNLSFQILGKKSC